MKIIAQQASDIAKFIDGRIEGEEQKKVNSISKIEEPVEDSLSFLANLKYEKFLYSGPSRTVLVGNNFTPKRVSENTLIYVDDVYGEFSKLLKRYSLNGRKEYIIDALSSISEKASLDHEVGVGKYSIVESDAIIGKHSQIKDQVYIGKNVKIGERVTIHPGVRILSDSVIGNDVTIHSNAVIGCDGFGFSPKGNEYHKIPQLGNVIIEDKVDIGSGTTIDRATIGSTIIKRGAKLDNLIQVGHNVIIGENVVIAAQSGIAGSTEIGKGSMLGGQVGISGHIQIAPYSQIQAKSGIASSITEKGKKWYGYPVLPYQNYLKSYALFKQLPDLLRRIAKLEKSNKS